MVRQLPRLRFAAGGDGLLGRPVAGGDGGPKGVAGGEQVAVAGAVRGVAEAPDEVRRGLVGRHVDLHRDGDVGEAPHDVVGQADVAVGAAEAQAVGALPGRVAAERAVAAVARTVGHGGAGDLVEGIVDDEALRRSRPVPARCSPGWPESRQQGKRTARVHRDASGAGCGGSGSTGPSALQGSALDKRRALMCDCGHMNVSANITRGLRVSSRVVRQFA